MKRKFTFLFLFITSVVWGNSSLQFHIECPADVTVSCEDELWDLSIYGDAYAYGYGSPTRIDSPEVEYYLNSCNVGSIIRTWSATDYSGNVYSCSQTITVTSSGYYNDLNIEWPLDYTVDACSADLSPGSLSPPYDYPTWNDQTCAMIMKNYSDAEFYVDKGCKKILRKWKLIDWCTYDPNKPNSKGYWEHTQILKVMSTEEPELDCINDITVSAGSDCYYTYVSIPKVTAGNTCNSDITISNNSPHADKNNENASGLYPLGTTMIKYTARDGCGNESTCKVKVTVIDQKLPVPICLHGLSATLAVHHDGYYVRLYPELFDKGSYDNCTKKKDLRLKVEPDILKCSDLDTARVKLIVTDEEGNSSYCETYVYITDNQGKCPPNNTVHLSGKVVNVNGLGVEGIDIELESDGRSLTTNSKQEGSYQIQGLERNTSYKISTHSDGNNSEITTLDGILMHETLKGNRPVQSVAMLAASDMNNDGQFTAYDIYLHKQVLLEENETEGYLSDKLINSKTELKNHFELPNDHSTLHIDDGPLQNDLILVGAGDVDGSKFDESQAFSLEPLVITSNMDELKAGQRYNVNLHINEAIDLLGYQYTLQFDEDIVQYLQINYNELKEVKKGDFGLSKKSDGTILCSFISNEGLNLSPEEAFLSLDLVLNSDSRLEDVISLSSQYLASEVYLSDHSKRPLSFLSSLTDTEENYAKSMELNVFPNPLSSDSWVKFNLPAGIDQEAVYIRLVGMDGKEYHKWKSDWTRGQNQFTIQNHLLNRLPKGVFVLQLVSHHNIISKRIINP